MHYIAKEMGAIRPTLFIGLGGTGKEVLLRLRRRFFETFGEPGLPCAKFLWMDTDIKDTGVQGEVLDEKYKQVLFSKNERVDLLSHNVGQDLADIFRNKEKHRHIHRWLYPQVEQFGAQISNCAGNVRAIGRLTWFSQFGEIETRIATLAQSVLNVESIENTKALFLERGYETAPDFIESRQAVVVFSAAGGTGSGTFLDTAFLLRHTGKFGRIIGICVLPNVYFQNKYDDNSSRSYANAYAALKELEYYTVRRTFGEGGGEWEEGGLGNAFDYSVQWNRGENKKIQGPPFDFVYMLERQNESGVGLESRSDFFRMVGEALYMKFMPGAFSTAISSGRSEVIAALASSANDHVRIGEAVLPQTFTRRYATFGMAKLGIPTEALKNACACQLAADLIGFWTRECEDSDILRSVQADVGERGLSLDGIAGRFIPGWKDEVSRRVEAIAGPLRAAGRNCSLMNVESARHAAFAVEDAYIGTGDDAVNPEQNLPYRFNVRGPAVMEEVRQALDAWVNHCLDHPQRGLKGLLMTEAGAGRRKGYLQVLIEQLQAVFLSDESELKKRLDAAEVDADRWREERDDAFEELKLAVTDTRVDILGQRAAAVEILGRRMMEAEEQYLLCQADAALYGICREVVQEASGILSERAAGLDEFAYNLPGLTELFLERKHAYLKPSENVLFIQVYDEKSDWPKFYKLGNAEVNLADETRLLLGASEGLYSLYEKMKESGKDELKEELRRHCEQRFSEDFWRYQRDVDLLRHPILQDQERLTFLAEQLAQAGLGRACLNADWGRGFNVRREAYVGIADDDSEQRKRFVRALNDALAGKNYSSDSVMVLPTNSHSEVYLYTETYAFPVGMIGLVARDCHEAYYSFYRESPPGRPGYKIPLHLDRRWEGQLDDLVWLDDADARKMKEAYEILLFGAILGITFRGLEEGILVFGCYRLGRHFVDKWGGRRDATETLKTDSDLRRDFLRAIKEREDALTPDQLQAYAMAILYLGYVPGFGRWTIEGTLLLEKYAQLRELCAERGIILKVPPDDMQEPEKVWEWVEGKVAGLLERTEDSQFPGLKGLGLWAYDLTSDTGDADRTAGQDDG